MACAERARAAAAACALLLLAAPAAAQVVPGLPVLPPSVTSGTGATPVPLPAGRWTVAQLRQSFALADADTDGQLSRAEGQQLAILPRSFEEMDANKDGVLSRAEYEGAAG